jgi:prolyl 3-hydroxylase /prolyl 3,4-dihydroxylase
MACSRDRSLSPPVSKRLKTVHSADNSPALGIETHHFAPGSLDQAAVQLLRTSYLASKPFKYAVVEKLFQDELLKAVKDECLSELSFREKETDIYKVFDKLCRRSFGTSAKLFADRLTRPVI